MTHLWEMETSWFQKPDSEYINSTFTYKSWKEFQECKPYKLWKPYILSSWSWKHTSDIVNSVQTIKKNIKHTFDCSNQLRINPSEYDRKKRIPIDETNSDYMLQIVFISPDRFSGMHRVEMKVQEEDEEEVRAWLKNHMPTFWKV